jgi:hypothetical protein
MFRMVKAGIVKTGSIGFIPTKFRRPDEEERKELGIGEYGYLFEEVELIEFSIVPLPANPSAMMEPITKGLITKQFMETITEKRIFGEPDMVVLRTAWNNWAKEHSIVVDDNEQPAPIRSTPIIVTDPNPEIEPVSPLVKEMGKMTFNLVGTKEQMPELFRMIDTFKKDHDVTCNVTLTEKSQGTELADICALMRDIKTKTLLTKEQKNVIQDAVTHVTALMECLQELLDASSAEESEEGEEEGKSGPVTLPVPPVGEKAIQDLYNPEFLRKIEEKTIEINNLGKGK